MGSVITIAASYINLNSNLVMTSPFADPASVTYVPSLSLVIVRVEGGVKITTDPQPLPAGFVVQYGTTVSGPWVTQAGLDTPVTVPIGAEARRFVRVAKP